MDVGTTGGMVKRVLQAVAGLMKPPKESPAAPAAHTSSGPSQPATSQPGESSAPSIAVTCIKRMWLQSDSHQGQDCDAFLFELEVRGFLPVKWDRPLPATLPHRIALYQLGSAVHHTYVFSMMYYCCEGLFPIVSVWLVRLCL